MPSDSVLWMAVERIAARDLFRNRAAISTDFAHLTVEAADQYISPVEADLHKSTGPITTTEFKYSFEILSNSKTV